MKTPRLLFALFALIGCMASPAKDTCFDCHIIMEGMSLKFTNDIHLSKQVSCANCHGGDQNEINQNISMSASRGFKVRVTRPGVPALCAQCHGDTNYMAKYEAQPRADEYAKYTNSVHGKALASGTRRAAECVDCHSVHDIRAPSDPLSTVNPKKVARTCAKCHSTSQESFALSRHAEVFTNAFRAACVTCHDSHEIQPATDAMLAGPNSVCLRCHEPGEKEVTLAEQMSQVLAQLEAAGPGSKEALDKARAAVHSLNLAAVRQAAGLSAAPPNPGARSGGNASP